MADINIPDNSVRQISIKNNVVLNQKAFATQNINFQEILANVGPDQTVKVSRDLSPQSSSSSLEFIAQIPQESENTKNREENQAQEKNLSATVKIFSQNEEKQSVIYSSFLPQEILPIEKENLYVLNNQKKEENSEKEIEEKPLAENKIKQTQKKSLISEPRIIENSDEKSREKNELPIEKKETGEDLKYLPTIKVEEEKQSGGDQEKPKKQPQWYSGKDQDEEEKEILRIIEVYDLNTLPDKKIKPESNKFTVWLTKTILEAGKNSLTITDAELLSRYVVSPYQKLPYEDKNFIYQTLSQIFQHQISGINENCLVRLEAKSLEVLFRLLPAEFATGLLKNILKQKFGKKKKKNLARIIFKTINALPLTDQQVIFFESILLEKPGVELRKSFQDFFQGRQQKLTEKQIYSLFYFFQKQDFKIPGFLGNFQEIYLTQYKSEKKQIVIQLKRILANYYQKNPFSPEEITLISRLIAHHCFSDKRLNPEKIIGIIKGLISNQDQEFFSPELLFGLTGKNPLNYLPINIRGEIRDYLKYLPISTDETFLADKEPEMVKISLRINLFYQGEKLLPDKLVLIINQKQQKIEIKETKDQKNFTFFLQGNRNYSFKKLIFSCNKKNNKISLEKLNEYYYFLDFFVPLSELFAYGTLNIYLDQKYQLKKISKNA